MKHHRTLKLEKVKHKFLAHEREGDLLYFARLDLRRKASREAWVDLGKKIAKLLIWVATKLLIAFTVAIVTVIAFIGDRLYWCWMHRGPVVKWFKKQQAKVDLNQPLTLKHLIIGLIILFLILWAWLPRRTIAETDNPQYPVAYSEHKPAPKLHVKRHKKVKPVAMPKAAIPAATPLKTAPVASGCHREAWLKAVGIAKSDWPAVDFIIGHEGGWCGVQRYNTGGSGAYGICQALPGNKMASAGSDWATNGETQLRWCDSYAKSKGGWWASYNFWVAHNWW